MTAQLVLHGARGPGGRAGGPPTTLAMRRERETDSVTVARQARALIHSGTWRRAPRTGSDFDRVDYVLRRHTPAALALFPRPALHALARRPPLTGCTWCTAQMLAALDFDGEAELVPTAALQELLGKACSRCRQRWAVAARVAEVRAETDLEQQLIASGSGPLAARIVTVGRRLGFPRDTINQAFAAAVSPPAQPPRRPPRRPPAPSIRGMTARDLHRMASRSLTRSR
jgi:hypothetical protein